MANVPPSVPAANRFESGLNRITDTLASPIWVPETNRQFEVCHTLTQPFRCPPINQFPSGETASESIVVGGSGFAWSVQMWCPVEASQTSTRGTPVLWQHDAIHCPFGANTISAICEWWANLGSPSFIIDRGFAVSKGFGVGFLLRVCSRRVLSSEGTAVSSSFVTAIPMLASKGRSPAMFIKTLNVMIMVAP